MKRTLLLICTLLCANVLFAQYSFWEGYLRYEITGAGKVKVSSCTYGVPSVNIPSSVTKTWEHYRDSCQCYITDSIRTYSVTSIGGGAFYGCSSLTSVTIPNSVTSIGNGAFRYCSSLTSITIPNSVTSIGDYAFKYCSSLTSVTLPNSVTSIEDGTFYDCSSLTSITIPNSVTSIRDSAFYNCSSLTSVTLPENITYIGSSAFYHAGGNASVIIDSVRYQVFPATIPRSYYANSYRISGYGPITFHIGDSTYAPTEALVYYCDQNRSGHVDILSSIELAGNTYPVTTIGDYAFYDCSSLTSITIPNSVTRIGGWAFYNCSSLTSVTLPNSVNFIGYHAFYDAGVSPNVVIDSAVTYRVPLATIPESYYVNLTGYGLITFHIGDSTYAPTEAMVSSCEQNRSGHVDILSSIEIAGNTYPVTSIESGTFYNCSSLTSVTIPNSVTSIGGSTFSGCSSLTSVTIGNSVTSIEDYTFEYCSSLTSITIPNSVTSIGDYAFKYCSSLTSVTLPNSVNFIGYHAFYNCSSLTSIDIPNSVTSIEDYAFASCSGLTSVTIPNSVTSIYVGTFWGCSSLTSVNIGNSVTSIRDDAFKNCSSLISVTIPNSVISISSSAFSGCSSLTSVTIPNSVTRIGGWAFYNCSSLTSVTIPNSVTRIGEGAFYNCSGLTTLNYNAINCYDFYNYDYYPFEDCPITTINIGDSVQRIPNYFAYNLDSLTSVTIGNSVDTIGYGAFADCDSLTFVTCLADIPPALGNNVFNNTPSNKILYVNCGLKDDYISSWGDYFNSNNIQEITFDINTYVNNESGGSVAIERNNCSTATLTATANICYQFVSWNDGNTENPRVVYLSSDTSFTAIFDSILFDTTINATINAGETYTEFGFDVNEEGTYTRILITEDGCDSIVTLSLSIIPVFNTELSATICQGQTYTENGFNVSEAGTYTQILTASNGFDSIVTLSLNVLPIFNTELYATICQGQVYNENGFNVSEAGVYTQTLTSVNGCDSIVTLSLNVNPTFNTELSANICQGQVYNENGFNVSEAGVYTQTLTSANGCDSIVTLTLNVNPTFNTELSATICEGQVYNEQGFNVSEAGVYTQTLTSANGCDSIVTLTLNVNPTFNTELSATICQGQVYNEQGFNVSEAGVYTQTLQTINGCDSVVTLTVSVNPTFDTTINATINAGETYAEYGFNESEAGTYVQNLQTEFGCDSTITLVLSVNSSLLDVEQTEISFYPNPTDSKVIFSQMIEKIEVIDLTGKTIFTFTNAKTINIESLPSGAYYLRLTNNDKAIMRKVIKE